MGFEKRVVFIMILAALFLVFVNVWTAKPYFGKWQIDSIIGYNRVFMSDEIAMEKRGGLVLNFTLDQALYPEYKDVLRNPGPDPIVRARNPVYEERIISDAEFYKYSRIYLKQIGINKEEIVKISIIKDGKWVFSFFYDAEKDQVITKFEGVWLSARRLKWYSF